MGSAMCARQHAHEKAVRASFSWLRSRSKNLRRCKTPATEEDHVRADRSTETGRVDAAMDASKSVSGKTSRQPAIEHARFGKGHAAFRNRSDELGIEVRTRRFGCDLSDE